MEHAISKRIYISLLFFIVLSMFSGCAPTTPSTSLDVPPVDSSGSLNDSQVNLRFIQQEKPDYQLNEIDLSAIVEDGMGLGCLTAAGQYIYYELSHIDSITGNYIDSTIHQLDTVTGASEAVTSIKSDELFFSNELICVGEYLFWVYRDSDDLNINYFHLKTKEHGVLSTYSTSMPDLILSGDNQFLTWYVPNDQGISLFCYDTLSDEIVCLTNSAATDSPYTRAYVNNGVVSYLENRDDSRLMIAYDLAKQQELFSCPLSKDFILTRLQANTEYAICTEGYTRDAPLFLLNQTKDEFERITVDGCTFSVFSCHLFDKFIIINSNSTKNILLLSISDGSYYPYETKSNIIQSAVSPDGLFYGCNPAANLIFYLALAE